MLYPLLSFSLVKVNTEEEKKYNFIIKMCNFYDKKEYESNRRYKMLALEWVV